MSVLPPISQRMVDASRGGIIEAELPDGTILEFPEGTQPSIIQNTVKNVLETAQQPTPQSIREQSIREVGQDRGFFETGAISTGRGLAKIGRALGLANVSDIFAPETEAEKIAFGELERQRPITTMVGEAVGESLPFAPIAGPIGGIASKVARPAAAAGVGALEAGLIRKGEGAKLEEQAIGAGIGGVTAGAVESFMPVLGRIGNKIIRRVTGRPPKGAILTADGVPTPELKSALDQTGLTVGDLSEAAQDALKTQATPVDLGQLARQQALKSEGLEPTAAQITRQATDFQEQQELRKVSGKVRSALERQEGLLVNKFDDAVAGTGGEAVTSGSPISDHVLNKATSIDNQISKLYDQARKRSKKTTTKGTPREYFGTLSEMTKEQSKKLDESITKTIEKAEQQGMSDFGVRIQKGKVGVGDELEKSTQFGDTWDGEELIGTSTIGIDYDGFDVNNIKDSVLELQQYANGDDNIILVGGRGSYEGTDIGERVIENAEVLDVLNKPSVRKSKNVVDVKNVASVLKRMQPSNTAMKGMPKAMKGELEELGIIDDKFNVLRDVTVDEAEDNIRKMANSLFNSTSDFGRQGIKKIKDAVDYDVTKSAGEDVFKQARSLKAKFEKDLSTAKISKFDTRRKSIVRDILENKLDPDDFLNKTVLSKATRASDLKEIKRYLSTGNQAEKDAGKKAFDDLRAETIDWIKNNSFVGPEDVNGNRALSRAKLESSLKRIGNDKMTVLFDDKERNFLKRMLNISKIREPVSGTAIGKGPSAQAVEGLIKLAEKVPIVGNLATDFDISRRGSIMLKASPEPIKQKLLTVRKPEIGGVGGAFVAPAVVSTQEERE